MATVTIVIDEETAESLRRLAELEKRSESDIVRTALAAYATALPRPQGIGKYRSGGGNISAKARETVRKDVQDGRWP